MLEKWAGQLLHLVDPWLSQTADYLDVANVNQTEQDRWLSLSYGGFDL